MQRAEAISLSNKKKKEKERANFFFFLLREIERVCTTEVVKHEEVHVVITIRVSHTNNLNFTELIYGVF